MAHHVCATCEWLYRIRTRNRKYMYMCINDDCYRFAELVKDATLGCVIDDDQVPMTLNEVRWSEGFTYWVEIRDERGDLKSGWHANVPKDPSFLSYDEYNVNWRGWWEQPTETEMRKHAWTQERGSGDRMVVMETNDGKADEMG